MDWFPTKYAALATALLLAACGGGGNDASTKLTFTSLVTFGDSLSDVGTYKVGAIAALGGGQFTVNGTTTGPVNWTELLASQLNLTAPCAAQTGLLSNIPSIPLVAVTDHSTCTNYAQGSSRVTSPVGPHSVALQNLTATQDIGLMAVPLVTQFTNHLAAHGNYTGTELVTVLAGANDAFMHINAVGEVAKWVGGDPASSQLKALGAAALAGWSTAEQTAIATAAAGGGAAGAAAAVNAAATAAVTNMAVNAGTLAGYINDQVLLKGAKYVVVVNLPSIEKTPFGPSTSASTQALLKTMVTTFNSTLASSLPASAHLLQVNLYDQSVDQYDHPAQYSITNVTAPACAASPARLDGYSLACTAASTLTGVDVSNYQFADSVHPTPAGHKLLDRFVTLKMAQKGWL